jgi:6-phosphogluconate dehydrogenase (decarboxylating)
MKPIFESIAAKVDGEPCVIHIGPGGAGHYVKMIHNGIEYGDMQLICEAYNIFKHAGFTTDEIAAIFNEWNEGVMQSYLIQISGKALEQKDPETGASIVELIVDKAGQKGTGQWTLMNAAENAIVISTINAAVEARILSSKKKARVAASTQLTGPTVNITTDKAELVNYRYLNGYYIVDRLIDPGRHPGADSDHPQQHVSVSRAKACRPQQSGLAIRSCNQVLARAMLAAASLTRTGLPPQSSSRL